MVRQIFLKIPEGAIVPPSSRPDMDVFAAMIILVKTGVSLNEYETA